MGDAGSDGGGGGGTAINLSSSSRPSSAPTTTAASAAAPGNLQSNGSEDMDLDGHDERQVRTCLLE
jgi:hypothetical protein